MCGRVTGRQVELWLSHKIVPPPLATPGICGCPLVKFQNPAMLNRLDPGGVTQNPRGRSILYAAAYDQQLPITQRTAMNRRTLSDEVFQAYDSDSSGELSADELATLLTTYEPRLDAAGVQRRISNIAQNGVVNPATFHRSVLRPSSSLDTPLLSPYLTWLQMDSQSVCRCLRSGPRSQHAASPAAAKAAVGLR